MITDGNPQRPVWLVGECPGPDEMATKRAFSGWSGRELRAMLAEAGISEGECYFTNLLHQLPKMGKTENHFARNKTAAKAAGYELVDGMYPDPLLVSARDVLRDGLDRYRPNLVIALGAPAFWAICGLTGITKWRGSILRTPQGLKCIPTYNPANITKNWPLRWVAVQDFRRCFHEKGFPEVSDPDWKFYIRPSFSQVIDYLDAIKEGQPVTADCETRGHSIDCWGMGISKVEGMCIPFSTLEGDASYWSLEEEIAIVRHLRSAQERAHIIMQNGIYDCQYAVKEWGYCPNIQDDTMIMHHVAWPGLEKSLDFISSLHCSKYVYWKDEKLFKEWDPKKVSEEQHWSYNCKDLAYTFECWESIANALHTYNLWAQYREQMEMFAPVLEMALRGVAIDHSFKNDLHGYCLQGISSRQQWIEEILGHPFNVRSVKAMSALFYGDFQQRVVLHRKTKKPTLNADALEEIAKREPLLIPLTDCISEIRTLSIFDSNYAMARLEWDGQAYFCPNPTGTETFRYAMNEGVFGNGMGLQVISKGRTEEDVEKARAIRAGTK